MAIKSVDNNSKFNIYSSFTLSNDDVAVLSLLYAPLMGSDALMLYLGLTSLLERNNLKSEELTHKEFFEIFSFTSLTFTKARIKLEGIGLLMVYEKEEKYVYVLCPPLTAKNFLKDATLGLYLYSKVDDATFNSITEHFKIEKIDKAQYTNITKTFDEVYTSSIDNEVTFDKFKYILGKKPNKNIKIKNYNFNFESFQKQINLEFLETGITKTFKDQICNIAFVYHFDEYEMAGLYQDSINKKGLFDYRRLKEKANVLFIYKRNMKAPKLIPAEEEIVQNEDLINYLENCPPIEFLEDILPNYPEKYLELISEIYANIELPRGVVNCMVMKVMKDKGGDLPNVNYFRKLSETWIKDKVFTTSDAITYVTTLEKYQQKEHPNSKNNINDGWDEL